MNSWEQCFNHHPSRERNRIFYIVYKQLDRIESFLNMLIENIYVEFEAWNYIKTYFIYKDHEMKILNMEEIAS